MVELHREGSAPAACAAGLFIKKDKKSDTLAVIDNYNFYDRHTYIHAYGHGDSMTDRGWKDLIKAIQYFHTKNFINTIPSPYTIVMIV